MDDNFKERVEIMNDLAEKIQKTGIQFQDIREREWLNCDNNAGIILKKLIEVENLFLDLDDYISKNGLDYIYIEDFMNAIGDFRDKFTKYIDENPGLIEIKTKK